jgi:hypothetical protein
MIKKQIISKWIASVYEDDKMKCTESCLKVGEEEGRE